ncbi:Rho GTPase activation protein [Hyaloraphidium curvatum]|nr:Rho GTPase activation protein [Hyaloraphidium curvatum]
MARVAPEAECAEVADASAIVYSAGKDSLGRPILVIALANLPDPARVPYDLLLDDMVRRTSEFVSGDYVLVLFAKAGTHLPTTWFLYRAYSTLGRAVRKNVKAVYVVHTSTWIKWLFHVFAAIVSPKFARKLVWIDRLSKLADYCVVTEIPEAVLQYNKQLEDWAPQRVFGTELPALGLPRIVEDACASIVENGLEIEGIFRKSPSAARVRSWRERYESGTVEGDAFDGDANVAASLLKAYVREMPRPIVSKDSYSSLGEAFGSGGWDRFWTKELIPTLDQSRLNLLTRLLLVLHEVQKHAGVNKMSASNLALVWAPNFAGSDMTMTAQLAEALAFAIEDPSRVGITEEGYHQI